MTVFLAGVAAGMFGASLVLALCAAASDGDDVSFTPGLWIVNIDEAGDITAAEPLDERRPR